MIKLRTLHTYMCRRLEEKSTYVGFGAACGSVIAVVPDYARMLGAVMFMCGVIVTLLPTPGATPDA